VLEHPTGYPRRDVIRMNKLATASINNLRIPEAEVPPSEEPVFILSSGQLQEIISRALQPLQDEVAQLQATVASQDEKIAVLTATQDTQADNQLIQLRLINQLREAKAPGKTETTRAEKIERYLQSRPDHRATFETLKGMLQVDNVLLSQAIKTLIDCSPGRYGITKAPGDKRKRTIVMLPK